MRARSPRRNEPRVSGRGAILALGDFALLLYLAEIKSA